MSRYIEVDAYIKYCDEHWIPLNVDAVNAQPTADVVERKSGKWEIDSDTFPICSKCGEIALQRIFVKVPHLIQDVRMVRSNYCPNCGARMDER